MKAFTTWGPVRGCCGHLHESERTAAQCLAKDQRGCKGQGGYSDRGIRLISNMREFRRFDVNVGPGTACLQDDAKIKNWLKNHGFLPVETRANETGYAAPDGAFFLLNRGDNDEPPFWALFYPPGTGEQADETGMWEDTPNYDPC